MLWQTPNEHCGLGQMGDHGMEQGRAAGENVLSGSYLADDGNVAQPPLTKLVNSASISSTQEPCPSALTTLQGAEESRGPCVALEQSAPAYGLHRI